MEKLNDESFSKLLFKKSRGKKSIVFKALSDLQPGESVKILKTEVQGQNQVSRCLYYLKKKYHYQFIGGRLFDGSGWAYKRQQ